MAILEQSRKWEIVCAGCAAQVRFITPSPFGTLAFLCNRVMPNLREWEPDLRFAGFVEGYHAQCMAVRIECMRCDAVFELTPDVAEPIGHRGGLLQCLKCGPMRRGRAVAKEFFYAWCAYCRFQKTFREEGWRLQIVRDDTGDPPDARTLRP